MERLRTEFWDGVGATVMPPVHTQVRAGHPAGISDWNPGREAVQAPWRPLRPVHGRYRQHRKGWGRGRPLGCTRHFGPEYPHHLRPQLLNLAWTSSGACRDPTFIVQAPRIPAQSRGAMSATGVFLQGRILCLAKAPQAQPFVTPVGSFSLPLY